MRKYLQEPTFVFGLFVFVFFIFLALGAPYFLPSSFYKMNLSEQLQGPSLAHPLGQNHHGQDLLTIIVYGARTSLLIGISTVVLSFLIGTLIGVVSGFFGGLIDSFVSRVTDLLLAFPGLLLAITVVAILPPSFLNIVIALSIGGWIPFARLVRSKVLALRESEFVRAATISGAGPVHIIHRHLLPHLWGILSIQAVFSMANAILAESSLSFLGIGFGGDIPSWGAAINDGTRYLLQAPHVSLFPGLAIVFFVLSLYCMGEGVKNVARS